VRERVLYNFSLLLRRVKTINLVVNLDFSNTLEELKLSISTINSSEKVERNGSISSGCLLLLRSLNVIRATSTIQALLIGRYAHPGTTGTAASGLFAKQTTCCYRIARLCLPCWRVRVFASVHFTYYAVLYYHSFGLDTSPFFVFSFPFLHCDMTPICPSYLIATCMRAFLNMSCPDQWVFETLTSLNI
jgi:hypothetical protein